MIQLQHWLLAIRPKTLGISIAPVIAGCSLAWAETASFDALLAITTLLAAICIQIGTNLYNDAADFERGADTAERLGPKRAAAQGWFTAKEIKRAALLFFGLAFLIGIYLAFQGGWPIVAIGLLSLFAGYSYTGGKKPIAYSASGEIFVFIFFGLAAVAGTYYLQTLNLSISSLLFGCAIGFLAATVLLVNNYRDLETDRKANKLTLSFYLGREKSKWLYATLLLLPFTLPLTNPQFQPDIWLLLLALPFALWLIAQFFRQPPGKIFNVILARTAVLQLIFSLLLALSLVF